MHDRSSEAGPLTRVRLDVSYDGTDFSGWARQPGRRTVQETLERALATVLRVPAVALTVAGRTDAGVHATGQVAHADLPTVPEVRSLNGVLPADVRVRAATAAPAGFDARFGALWRRYEYRLCDGVPDPRRRRYVLAVPGPLDVPVMDAAAHALVGLHDFTAFCRHREGATAVRHLLECTVTRDGGEVACLLRADAFCHSMVRSVVGALVAVGGGRRPVSWPASLLGATGRSSDVRVVAPHGLTLTEIAYPADADLVRRAEQTRARRETHPHDAPTAG